MANVATIAAVASVQYAGGASITVGNNRIEVTKLPLWVFCRNLERYSDRQIIVHDWAHRHVHFRGPGNAGGLYGHDDAFRAVLRGAKLPPEAQTLLDTSQPSAIGDALQQVGLKLERRRAPLDILVVDSALKTPTAN